jgi:hypothetical protein
MGMKFFARRRRAKTQKSSGPRLRQNFEMNSAAPGLLRRGIGQRRVDEFSGVFATVHRPHSAEWGK